MQFCIVKTYSKMITAFVTITQHASNATGYAFGAVIALLIFGYLLYSLVKPEKF
jgi:K+-transporting ATPase KdpF subunit